MNYDPEREAFAMAWAFNGAMTTTLAFSLFPDVAGDVVLTAAVCTLALVAGIRWVLIRKEEGNG